MSVSQRHPALPIFLPTALPPVCPHHANCRGDEKPAVFDDGPRPVADHIFDVIVETLSTCGRGQGWDPLTATREGGQQGLRVQGPASPLFRCSSLSIANSRVRELLRSVASFSLCPGLTSYPSRTAQWVSRASPAHHLQG